MMASSRTMFSASFSAGRSSVDGNVQPYTTMRFHRRTNNYNTFLFCRDLASMAIGGVDETQISSDDSQVQAQTPSSKLLYCPF